jgi:hypothetical protein
LVAIPGARVRRDQGLRNLRITAHDRDEEQSFFVGIQDAVEVGR